MTLKERFLTQLLPLILGALAFWGGWKIMLFGFEEVQALRQLERTPIISLNSLIPGPTAVNGFAQPKPGHALVTSYHTNTPSLYYYYTHEIERRDSDGNTSWDLVDSKRESVNFLLNDHSKSIEINNQRFQQWIDWSVEQSYQVVTGDHRYTEYRIEPNDKLFIYGLTRINHNSKLNQNSKLDQISKNNDQPQFTLEFPPADDYTPIISTYDKSYEQQRMGSAGVFYLWAGLALIAMSMYALAVLIRIHKVWKYQTLLSFCVGVILIHFSLLMMDSDLKQATERYHQQWQFTLDQLEQLSQQDQSMATTILTSKNAQFEDYYLNQELIEYKLNLAMSAHLLDTQLGRFPEWMLAPIWGYSLDDSQRVQLHPSSTATVQKRIDTIADSKLTSVWHYLFFFFGLGAMVLCSYFGFRKIKFKRLIENIPTQKTLGLVPGMAEVEGTIVIEEDKDALKSPMTSSQCCWYHYTIREKRGSGKNASWVTILDDLKSMNFLCEDDEGQVKVIPKDAEIITSHTYTKSSGSRRHTERLLKINDPLYVIGKASLATKEQDKLVLATAGKDLPFIISNLSESKVMFRKAWLGLLFLNLAFTGIVSSGLLWFAQSGSFSPSDFLLAALFGPIYMFLFSMMLHYNDIIFLRQRAERNWQNMGVAIRKRKNLIPSLETLVKEYMKHEQGLMEEIASFRTAFQGSINQQDNQQALETCLDSTHQMKASFKAVLENYPDLKTQELVSQLMDELTRLDTELALLKNGYNDAVTLYNERLETFPDILFTWLFKFQPKELFS